LILPYPGPSFDNIEDNEEELSLALLYRNRPTFAVGHGCSAEWETSTDKGSAAWVSAECLPVYEAPSMTPDIKDKDKRAIKVPMALLAGLVEGGNGFSTLEKIIDLYEEWIKEKEKESSILKNEYQGIAQNIYRELKDVQNGSRRLEFIKSNPRALRAFN